MTNFEATQNFKLVPRTLGPLLILELVLKLKLDEKQGYMLARNKSGIQIGPTKTAPLLNNYY